MKSLTRLRRTAAALAVAGAALAAAGCGSTTADTYTPAAYGVQVGHSFDCYYIESPIEAADLISAGLCPRGSIATPMPVTWEETYWSYYSSPAYYSTYMPANYRSTYTTVYVVHFKTTYSKQITADATRGTYKSSTGKTVTGTQVAKLKYGSTKASSRPVHGGGAGTVRSCSLSMTVLQDKSVSSNSHGGGSGTRTGTTKSKTGTSSGSKAGC